MTNGEFFHALELLGYETVEDCPIGEERIENVAKHVSELQAQLLAANKTIKVLQIAHTRSADNLSDEQAMIAQQAATISAMKRGIRDVAIWFENQPHDRDGGYSALHCIEQMRALVEDASVAKLPNDLQP